MSAGDGGGGGDAGRSGLKVLPQRGSESFLFPCRRRMTMVRHNHNRAFESGSGGGGDGLGPTGCGGAEEVARCLSDIYDVAGGSGSGGALVVRHRLQPFDISSTAAATTTALPAPTSFKFPAGAETGGAGAGGMAASLGSAFTSGQWKELERQAMIFKYMMASLPIPPELLMPITRNFSDPHSTCNLGRGSFFNLRFSNGADPEPGRCRRTDGKKWRCSRDVAPNQKYCERHMHRGRPRSRKPVEVNADGNSIHKKTRHYHPLPTTPAALSHPMLACAPCSQSQYLGSAFDPFHQRSDFLYKSDSKASPYPPLVPLTSFKEPGDQQWQQLMQTKIGLTLESSSPICNSTASVINQQYQEGAINLNSYSDSHNLFLNPDVAAFQKSQTETPRAFIDAWSSAVTENPANTCTKSPVSSNGKLPLSSLTLSMGGEDRVEDETGRTEIGLRTVSDDKPQLSTWPTPASWAGSAPGGPLAEVLRPSSIPAASNPASPHGGNGDSIGPSEAAASSPSGVLQKPVVSPSDSSGNCSPTLNASPAKAEITFPWLYQSKAASTE